VSTTQRNVTKSYNFILECEDVEVIREAAKKDRRSLNFQISGIIKAAANAEKAKAESAK
jgi:hypothetical protein